MNNHGIYEPAAVADRCYLKEILIWLMVGRPPPDWIDISGDPWRYSDVRDSWFAPIPDNDIFDPTECSYAGLPEDPRYLDLMSDELVLDVDSTKSVLHSAQEATQDANHIAEWEARLGRSLQLEAETANWLAQLQDYQDQFQTELLLDLRRGKLTASGTEIPTAWLDNDDVFDEEDFWEAGKSEARPIPAETWISTNVNWEGSWLRAGPKSFVWIMCDTEKAFELYPPEKILTRSGQATPGRVYLAHSRNEASAAKRRRGRKPYDWEQFHVEVARLYATGTMPAKKEAAIQHFIEWFEVALHRKVGRSTIGQKLTPYFAKLK